MTFFYLGAPMPHWLRDSDVPLFVSHRRLRRYKGSCPKASCRWALDSGGFTELDQGGGWTTTVNEYVEACHRYTEEVGPMDWAAPMDWMCEPWIVAKTGKTVEEHQHLTTQNLHQLRQAAPTVPFIPVLQGWGQADYERHMEMYAAAGIDLTTEPTVGIGSVCRREYTDEIGSICAMVAGADINLHGFGVKSTGITHYGRFLQSADSMAWSKAGRHIRPCPHTGALSCNNCRTHAHEWRTTVIEATTQQRAVQLALSLPTP